MWVDPNNRWYNLTTISSVVGVFLGMLSSFSYDKAHT